MSDAFQKIFPKAYFSRLVEKNIRSDGRAPLDIRKTRIVTNAVSTADASALCTVGRTTVLCGIRYEIGPPPAAKPSSARVEIKVELGELCSPNPSETFPIKMEQALRRVVETGFIDLEDLCIQEWKAVWVLKCHLICLDDDGNLFDACTLAFTSAVRDLKLPSDIMLPEDGVVRITSPKCERAVKIRFNPAALTFGLFDEGQVMVADPSADEEQVLEGLVHFIVDSSSGNCIAVLKQGGPALPLAKFIDCLDLCQSRPVMVQTGA
jgi:exosome complex component RRP43